MTTSAPALASRGLGIRFGGHAAVDDVSAEFAAGTLTAIVGPNGAGKTTYFNLLSGQLSASAGAVHFKGEDITRLNAAQRTVRGIGRAFQLTNLFPRLSVAENVRLAVQSRHRAGFNMLAMWRSRGDLIDQAEAYLEQVGLAARRDDLAAKLPHGDKRKLEVAILMALEPEIVMFDEPTAGMSVDEVPVILELIRRLKARGDKTILLVEHKMDVIHSLADRIVVLHNGRLVADGLPAEVMASAIVQEAYLGVKRTPAPRREPRMSEARTHHDATPLLTLAGVHTHIGEYHILQGVDLVVPRAGLTVLLGRNGAGKSTTLRTIMGLWQASRGKLMFDGADITAEKTPEISRRGIAFVPEDMGIFSGLTVQENLRLAAISGRFDEARLEWIFGLFPALKRFWLRPGGTLSGGQKQMVAIARAIIEPRKLLLIDEPTKGLAPAIVDNLAQAFEDLKARDTTILLVEQNFHFVRSLGDHVAVMDDGRIVHAGSMQALSDDEALQARLLGLHAGAVH